MRSYQIGATLLRIGSPAVLLAATALLSGCASTGATSEAALYRNNKPYNLASLPAPAPVPAVRGYRERIRSKQMNDEQKYAAIYGVPARPDFLATAQPDDDPSPAVAAPAPRLVSRPQAVGTGFINTAQAANQRPAQNWGNRRMAQVLPRSYDQRRSLARTQRRTGRSTGGSTGRPVGFKTIVVTRGDTLYNLAWRYKTTMSALLKANKLRYANLEIGQQLQVPVYR